MQARSAFFTAILITAGALGGWVATFLSTPLPWLLGSLAVTASFAALTPQVMPEAYEFPQLLRKIFVATIGLMIGSQVTPALLQKLPDLALSLTALTLYAGTAMALNYRIFRHIGGYDDATAFFSSTPGGLVESITLGEEAGADIRLLTVQQFLRVILVVSLLPLAISIYMGAPVGSAAGMQLSTGRAFSMMDIPIILIAGAVGLGVGHWLRFPAGHLTGPLFVAAMAGALGPWAVNLPSQALVLAQIVIGASLGARFIGVTRPLLTRALGLSLLSVTSMLLLAALFALTVATLGDMPADVLLISFAPGGVIEMSLVALSLQSSPAFVTLHHLYRILLTVLGITFMARWRHRR